MADTATNYFDKYDNPAPSAPASPSNYFDKYDAPKEEVHSGTVPVADSVGAMARHGCTQLAIFPKRFPMLPAEAYSAANAGLNPFSQGYQKAHETQFGGLAATGQGILAIPAAAVSPITGTVRSVLGHTFADALHYTGEGIAAVAPNADTSAKDNPEKLYQIGKDTADTAMSAIGARKGPIGTPPAAVPDVLLSKGQQTGDLNFIKPEQKAAAGDLGPAAQQRAIQFKAQQDAQVQNANDVVARSFDQFNQNVAENPQKAGELVQSGLQQTKAAEKQAVTNKYDAARSLGGEIDASAVQNMGSSIKSSLTSRPDPVIIDDKLTPWANQAIGEIDKAAQFKIPNAANPVGAPNPNQITGVSLEGLDQVRRRLAQFKSGAWANNASDGRAASAVVDAFDDHVNQAVNSGAFRGNPDAVDAWNEARAASASFKQQFAAGKNDVVGKQIEKIIGPRGGQPLTPNDVADALYGGTGTNPGSKNVGVAVKTRNILGADSPEWSAVKQGLWSRLTERGTGQTEMGSGMIANRLSKFLNADGRDMANAVYSPSERQTISKYADLMRSLEIPKGAVMTAGSAPIVAPILRRVASGMSYVVGYALAHHLGFNPEASIAAGAATGKGTEILNSWRNGRQIAQQMPLVTEATQKFQNALAAYTKANSPPSRVALSVATTNLARTLKPLGISFDGLFPTGAAQAPAGQQQQQ